VPCCPSRVLAGLPTPLDVVLVVKSKESRKLVPPPSPLERLLRGKRVALVFGNDTKSLPATARDAEGIADVLKRCGYTLVGDGPVLNATMSDMEYALAQLRAEMADGATVVVYFAGHGKQGLLATTNRTSSRILGT
jgi:hypothetical protein